MRTFWKSVVKRFQKNTLCSDHEMINEEFIKLIEDYEIDQYLRKPSTHIAEVLMNTLYDMEQEMETD